MSEPVCWLNGELMPARAARVPVLDHGLLYGDGVFEGIRFYHGRPFRLGAHLERLQRSAAALRLTVPLDRTELEGAVEATIAAYGDPDGYLRLVVTRGTGKLGLDPVNCTAPNVFIIADALAMVSEAVRRQGARVIIAATRRIGADALDPRIKSLNYLNHILARMEATNAGADEAILLNARGHVAEGSADNVFIVRGGKLLTPPVTDGALEGITRATVLELAAGLKIPAAEISLAPFDLYSAEECFLTGTGVELIPVREVDGRAIGEKPGPEYQRIVSAFRELVVRETSSAPFFMPPQG
jgi:branched-chain amino acid aminotransferase